jgi:hypothetical protein
MLTNPLQLSPTILLENWKLNTLKIVADIIEKSRPPPP